jgi:hypothetical protein
MNVDNLKEIIKLQVEMKEVTEKNTRKIEYLLRQERTKPYTLEIYTRMKEAFISSDIVPRFVAVDRIEPDDFNVTYFKSLAAEDGFKAEESMEYSKSKVVLEVDVPLAPHQGRGRRFKAESSGLLELEYLG